MFLPVPQFSAPLAGHREWDGGMVMRVVAQFVRAGQIVAEPDEALRTALAERYLLQVLRLGFPQAGIRLGVRPAAADEER